MPADALNDIVEQLLVSRGYTTEDEKKRFLTPDYDHDMHSPSLLVDIDRATSRVLRALETGERIAIYADFDCDGIPAAVVMHDFFTKIGYTNFVVYIPHRDTEGFGVHTSAIDTLHADGVTLIITVDVGSSALEQIAYAQEKGIDVIVADHHEFACDAEGKDILPPAYAVINPKRKPYPFPDLCGSGVAFQFVRACIDTGREKYAGLEKDDAEKNSTLHLYTLAQYPVGHEKWMLDMVGLATIADMVPLVGENRVLAKYGLLVLQKSRRPGILALCRVAKIDQQHITEETIGYTIAPRINAASRMGDARIAFELFSTQDPVHATACAEKLEHLNNERKGLVGAIAKSAHAKIRERFTALQKISRENSLVEASVDCLDLLEADPRTFSREAFLGEVNCLPPVVVLGDPDWKPSVLGSVASTLAEHYKRPFFLWGREGTGLLKGSCRTHGSVDVLAVMTHASHILIQHGGHKAAGGFAVTEINVHVLQKEFEKAYDILNQTISSTFSLPAQDQNSVSLQSEEEQPIDILVEHVSLETVRGLRKLAPFGMGNPEPVMRMLGIVTAVSQFGKEKNHFECTLANEPTVGKPSKTARCMAFFSSPDSFTYAPNVGDTVCVTGTISESRFAGRVRAEVRVEDIEQVETRV